MTQPQRLPGAARLIIAASVVSCLVALGVALVTSGAWDGDDVAAAAIVGVLLIVSELFWVILPHESQSEYFSVVGTTCAAGVILVRPAPLLVAVALGIAIGQLPRHPPATKLIFNVSQHVAGMGAATGVVALFANPGDDTGRTALVAIAALAVYFVINEAAVDTIIGVVERRSIVGVARASFRVSAQTWLGDVALGLIAAYLWTHARLYLIPLLGPVVLSYLAVRSQVRTTLEAAKMQEMALAAAAISQQEDLGRRMPEAGEVPHLTVLASTLNRMLERLEAAFTRERRFIREASHELRTPVTITRGYLEVLGTDPDPADVQEARDVALEELDRMGRLITDLTTLAKVDDPGFLLPGSIDLDGFIERIATKVRPMMDGRLVIDPVPAGLVVHADEQRLTQALLNLLQNAVVHTDHDTPIELRTRRLHGAWRFEVVDHGGGLPAGEQELIFQPFHRLNNDRPGSGLGLAIVKGIAEAHGGRAGVDVRAGEGATFWIEIPI